MNGAAKIRLAILICVLLLANLPELGAGETVIDRAQGFTLVLPDGFVRHPDLKDTSEIKHAFVLGDLNDDEFDIFLLIKAMKGAIGREQLPLTELPPGFKGRLFRMKWQGFEVDAFEVPEHLIDTATITYNVQIPLKRAAIQLSLFGPAERKEELERLLPRIVEGLEGESNWTGTVSGASWITASKNYRLILIGFAIVFVLGGLIVFCFISRKTPHGTVLAIAGGIYMASWAIDDVKVREVVLLAGAMRMLGFAGGILGVVDLIRRRRVPQPDPVDAAQ